MQSVEQIFEIILTICERMCYHICKCCTKVQQERGYHWTITHLWNMDSLAQLTVRVLYIARRSMNEIILYWQYGVVCHAGKLGFFVCKKLSIGGMK